MCLDHEQPLLEAHRLQSYEGLKGAALEKCAYQPSYVDPRDGKMVFTSKPLKRYEAIYDIVRYEDVILSGFYLTNKNLIPSEQIRELQFRK